MKHPRTLSSLAFLLCMTALSAQAPRSFSYQAVMRDPLSGHPLSDQAAAVLFTLHQGTASGSVVYAEQHAVTSNAQGLFSLQVGRGTPVTGAFGTIEWRNGPYFMEVGLDVGNSGAFTSMGTQELLSVPYALHAESSNVPDGTEVGQIAHWDGTTWVVDSGLYVSQKRFGIGVQLPEAPLSIQQRDHLYEKFQNGDIPSQNDFTVSSGAGTGLSFDQETSGGVASRLFLQSSTGHVGIGTQDPPAPLSIVHRNILKTFFQSGDVPNQNDFAFTSDSSGFGIDQGAPGSLTGRLFIQSSTGSIGLGTTQPQEKLHIEASSPNGTTGMKIKNQSTGHVGWVMGHINDNAIAARDGAFSLKEDGITSYERITVLPGGNTGVNETMPFATLHVTKPASDPTEPISLSENTGIAMFGPVGQHLVMDSHSIQARHLLAGATSLSGTSGTLRLQPLGGDLTVHADDASLSSHVTVTGDGKIGVGKDPVEKVDINGAITIGNTSSAAPADGTIRFNGTDFEGWVAGDWAIFNGSAWEKVDNTDVIHYSSGTAPRVGIGTSTPDATLHVSRQAGDPEPPSSLDAGSGLATFGDIIDSNINLMDDGLQARVPAPPGSPHVFAPTSFNLQPMGGDVLIHGSGSSDGKFLITGNGRVGLGTLLPMERLHVNGAIVLGDAGSTSPPDGTIRWNGTDFEGRKAGTWKSLTTHTNTDGLWQAEPTGEIDYSPPGGGAKVSVGLPAGSSTLRVDSWAAVVERSIGTSIHTSTTTSSTAPGDHRIGLQIDNTGTWGGHPASKNIGLYVSEVSGGAAANTNIAAVLNGNIVVGNVQDAINEIGTDGRNVLALQNGAPPGSACGSSSGLPDGGVQLWSANDATGSSVFHLMNGDGTVIKLCRASALTAANLDPIGPGVDPSTAALINNMRTRIDELEGRLKALGLLTP